MISAKLATKSHFSALALILRGASIFNSQQEDLTIFTKNKKIILDIKSGRLQTNQVCPEIVSFFDETNVKID